MRPSGSNWKRAPRHSTSWPTSPAHQTAKPKRSRKGTRMREAAVPNLSTRMADAAATSRTARPASATRGGRPRRDQAPERGLRDDIAEISGGTRDPNGARPADLVLPDVAPGARAEVRFDNGVSQRDALAQRGDAGAELIIVGEIVANGCEAADRVEIGARETPWWSRARIRRVESRRATSTLGANSVAIPSASALAARMRPRPDRGRSPGRRCRRSSRPTTRASNRAPPGCRCR